MSQGAGRAWLVAAAAAVLSACYAGSAARRSAERIEGAWDVEQRGPAVVWAGPGMTTLALGEFAVNSFRPPEEPDETWFHAYPGPLRDLAEVAVLCHRDYATNVAAIREVRSGSVLPARHARWQYPACIEALQGRYQLRVHYYSRRTHEGSGELTTRTLESSRPSVVEWVAEAGGIYRLSSVLGPARPAPEHAPRFFDAPPRPGSPGTTTFKLEVSQWHARIERVPSLEDLDVPVLQVREAWRKYESAFR